MGRNLKAFRYVWARPGGVMHRLPTWFPNVVRSRRGKSWSDVACPRRT